MADSDMAEELPVLPGFREMALRRRALLAELVARRHAAGLSQGEIAHRMGTSQPAVARLEAGLVDARMSTMQRYADAVGMRLYLGTQTLGTQNLGTQNLGTTDEDR